MLGRGTEILVNVCSFCAGSVPLLRTHRHRGGMYKPQIMRKLQP
jgi:hypothetical protein